MIKYFLIITVILLIIILEIERNYIIPYDFIDFYFKNFPNQLGYSLYNFFFKIYSKKIVFSVKNKEFNNYLLLNKNKLINEYFLCNPNKISIKAHKLSNIIKYNNSYEYIRFKYNNIVYKQNLILFPTIKKLLSKNSCIKTCFLSIMKKNIVIPYHRGSTNKLLRYHFPIIVDNINNCYMEIMGIKQYYDSPFAFDDTYPHMLKKTDDSLKVVLICDILNNYIF